MTSDKLDLSTPDLVNQNIEKIAALFPNCVTETAEGKAIDFDLLKQELNHEIVEGAKERYRLEWPGKKEAIVTANLPTTKTLRPVREDSVDFDTTENMYIEGDNLEVLKILQESYLGKIKMIYIDPPYNTGKDFVYKDNFTQDSKEYKEETDQIDKYGNRLVANPESAGRYHSDWLTMMYPRLKLARNLLTDDGVIFISIGEQEVHNLRKVSDEIFGSVNFIGGAGRISKKANNKGDYWAPNFDHVLTYCKNREFCTPFFGGINYDAYNLIEEEGSRKGEMYQLVRLYMTSLDPRPNQRYFIECPDGSFVIPPGEVFPNQKLDAAFISPKSKKDKVWRWSYKSYLEKKDEIVVKKVRSSNLVNEEGGETFWNVFTKTFLNDVIEKSSATPNNFIENHINQSSSHELKKLGIPFDFAKPSSLIKFLMETCRVSENDIVLDFFSGSASSAHAVLDKNAEDKKSRKFIMVQLPEINNPDSDEYKAGYKNICEIGKERIRRAATKIKEETKADIDYGFKVFKVDSSNMQDVYYKPQDYNQGQLDVFADNIKEDRTSEDLLTQILLDWGLPLTLKTETLTIQGKEVFKVDANYLMACFAEGVDEAFAKEIATYQPLRVVFKDSGFKDDTAKENVKQLLKQLSPNTEMKVI
ncbi:site-specific DNA-methyltransferase [Polaribacter glomeratus]|uniref:site-specific DNA-methyltransferase (adenine-specific) n=1 Tax=Polaribacter glomeratus TaxID=102 RepID=A0A2S7WYV1_9FLAO|nr:site-specific DNA-methyltransferase [Polaribacter glomeratus]PQJ82696.1 hypothetical protein BTO16_08960 [Polaribacter glomeratus]TXD63723.1 site-specific DNA-methyltransferase [Polaribacter glomeratus]